MSEAQGQGQDKGTIVRGSDGALYFIRDEILEQCKMPEDVARQAEQLISQGQGQSEGEGMSLQPVAHISGPSESEVSGYFFSMASEGTIMCPSVIFNNRADYYNIYILPAQQTFRQ